MIVREFIDNIARLITCWPSYSAPHGSERKFDSGEHDIAELTPFVLNQNQFSDYNIKSDF
ncbi:MAG: hypothetical protein JWQ71_1403 [Pedosphaera sp.]|nr:hypothetical protein [Pedosphaera sp.]